MHIRYFWEGKKKEEKGLYMNIGIIKSYVKDVREGKNRERNFQIDRVRAYKFRSNSHIQIIE